MEWVASEAIAVKQPSPFLGGGFLAFLTLSLDLQFPLWGTDLLLTLLSYLPGCVTEGNVITLGHVYFFLSEMNGNSASATLQDQ